MITIKDVARLSGVSISTVSRVINDSKPVSPEVRKKVLEIIKETGYKPNDVARSLVTRKSYLIGVIINNLAQSYVADIVRGIEEIGKMYDYDILLCSSYFSVEAQKKYLQLLDRKQAEGIFLVGYNFDDEIVQIAKSLNKPCVYFTKNVKEGMNYISIDNFSASYEATNYMIKQGRKKIAFISDFENRVTVENDKICGYKKALKNNDINIENLNIYVANGRRYHHSYEIGHKILDDLHSIDAILCSNDELAIGIMNYLLDNGIKIPEDISVMGFGSLREGKYVRPELTSIGEPFYDYGAVGMRMLIKTIKGEKHQTGQIELPFTIEKRESVKIKEK
ncbi:LacI family DNA-binding transcriptional regulator [Sedimentibacter sp. zth1]|uniref:LacI family DNA-binding transcriptional regulator n=1 Tax=Sedimentibacter sp. zth1 TaxID=2816908 RepID=UPI001A930534|nr:LacI family DNA-binding transcriptional regulator [Sedimentibacter sp. zth1]QSX04901.1 LacI family DNA-binding transcriptional regulator [Sedimentibacter sp. zth1]